MILLRVAALISLLLTGLVAGLFYAWVCTTMWGLDATDPHTAIKAMSAMNISVSNGVFFPSFFLTPIALLVATAVAWWYGFKRVAAAFGIAMLVYVFGAFLPTALVNVPMNRTLEAAEIPAAVSDAKAMWETYSTRWQWWNQARTLASCVSLLLVGWGVMQLPGSNRPAPN